MLGAAHDAAKPLSECGREAAALGPGQLSRSRSVRRLTDGAALYAAQLPLWAERGTPIHSPPLNYPSSLRILRSFKAAASLWTRPSTASRPHSERGAIFPFGQHVYNPCFTNFYCADRIVHVSFLRCYFCPVRVGATRGNLRSELATKVGRRKPLRDLNKHLRPLQPLWGICASERTVV